MAGKLFDALFKQPTHVKKLADGNLEFALNLYQKIAEQDEDGNVFFAPFSVTVALAMTNVGARGKTSEELRNTLKLDSFETDSESVHSAFRDVLHSLSTSGGSSKHEPKFALHLANKVFLQESYKVLEDFEGILSSNYKADVSLANFAQDTENVRQEINQWVEEATGHKIKNLLTQGTLDKLTRLVLINAVYFKGKWSVPFDPRGTLKSQFHRKPDDKVPTDLMRTKAHFPYVEYERLKCQIVELPYFGNRLAMTVLLPNDPEGLLTLEKQLTVEVLKDITSSLKSTEVTVLLPKFHLEIGVALTEILKKLGIQDLFVEGKADLSGISEKGDLYVSHAIHKAVLEVNEEGTEATAATALAVNRMRRSAIPEFIANHPFIFLIYDKASEFILFMGRLLDPPLPLHKEPVHL